MMRRFNCTVENGRAIPRDLRRILVAIDFSDEARSVLEYAIELASSSGADVEVLHVWGLPSYTAMAQVPTTQNGDDTLESLTQHVHMLAVERLEELIASVDARGLKVHGRLESGEPVPVIVEASKWCDLVVVGAHHDDSVAGIVLGNVADRVAGEALCPVIAVREETSGETVRPPSHSHPSFA